MTAVGPAIETYPYIGLRPFQFEDSALFFGRRAQVNDLLTLLRRSRFLPMVGSSGCGKSSLLKAGLIPALRAGFLVQDRDEWVVATMTPGDAPLRRLLTEVVTAFGPKDVPTNAGTLLKALEERGVGAIVQWVASNLGERKNLLLCVDQFEEIFAFRTSETATADGDLDPDAAPSGMTRARRQEADEFVALLLELARQSELPVYVVLTMRSDFLGDADVFRGLPEAMNDNRYLVPRLTRTQLAQAIEGPARLEDATIAPRLLDRMLTEVGDRPDQLPVLQHALLRTWQQWRRRDPERTGPILPVDYEAAGTLNGALSADAEAALKSIDSVLARRVFQSLTDTDPMKRRVRRSVHLAELAAVSGATIPAVARVLDAFRSEQRHFVFVSGPEDAADPRITITHESLIRRWPTLRGWVDQERDARDAFLDYARRAAQRGAGQGALLAGADLVLARSWRKNIQPTNAWAARYGREKMLNLVLSYIDKSRKVELWRNWSFGTGIAGAIVLLGVLALGYRNAFRDSDSAVNAMRRATREREAAEQATKKALSRAGDLAELFVASRTTNVTEATALLRDVSDTSMTGWTDLAYDVFDRGVPEAIVHVESPVWSVATSPDGRRIASGSADGVVRIWDADGTGPSNTLIGHTGGVNSVAFSPNGQLLASASFDHTIRVWRADGGAAYVRLEGHTQEVLSIAFSPDGQQLVSGSEDGTVRVWDLASRTFLTLAEGLDKVLAVAFSPDGKHVASASGFRVRIWNARGGEKPRVFEGHRGQVNGVAFSPDGQLLASGSSDKTLRIWETGSRGKFKVIQNSAEVGRIEFSSDGRSIAAASADRTVRIWKTDGTGVPIVLAGHADIIWSVAFTPDDRQVVSGSADKTLRIWRADGGGQPTALPAAGTQLSAVAVDFTGRHMASGALLPDDAVRVYTSGSGEPLVLKGHTDTVWSVAFSPDGASLGSASADRTLRVWDLKEKKPPRVLRGHENAVYSLAFSPDGLRIVSGSLDGSVRIWNSTGDGAVSVLRGHALGVYSVAFSPDGKEVASASIDNTIRIWNADGTSSLSILYGPQTPNAGFLSVAFSPDGKRVVAGSADATVQVWLTDGTGEPVVLKGHTGSVRSVAFSPDGQRVVSVSADHTMMLWNADGSGQPTVVGSGIQSVAFSGDGNSIVAVDGDAIRIYPGTTSRLLDALWATRCPCLLPARRQTLLYETEVESKDAYRLCADEFIKRTVVAPTAP